MPAGNDCKPAHTSPHKTPRRLPAMLWSWGLRGKVHDSLESPETPPGLQAVEETPPVDPGSNPGRSMLISRSCLITAADEIQKSLV